MLVISRVLLVCVIATYALMGASPNIDGGQGVDNLGTGLGICGNVGTLDCASPSGGACNDGAKWVDPPYGTPDDHEMYSNTYNCSFINGGTDCAGSGQKFRQGTVDCPT